MVLVQEDLIVYGFLFWRLIAVFGMGDVVPDVIYTFDEEDGHGFERDGVAVIGEFDEEVVDVCYERLWGPSPGCGERCTTGKGQFLIPGVGSRNVEVLTWRHRGL